MEPCFTLSFKSTRPQVRCVLIGRRMQHLMRGALEALRGPPSELCGQNFFESKGDLSELKPGAFLRRPSAM